MSDSPAPIPSPFNGPAASQKRERNVNNIWEFWLVFLGAFVGILHSWAVMEAHASLGHIATQVFTEMVIFGALGFIIREIKFLRDKVDDIEEVAGKDRLRIISTEIDTKNELARLCIRAERGIGITQGIYGTIGKAYSHNNEMVRRFLMGSIGESLQPLSIEPDLLVARGDIFTRSLYRNFWDELLSEQKKRGKRHPLQVYVSHASSISVFEDQGRQTDVLVRQGEFAEAGGVVRRVLIRNPMSESKERYEAVKTRMEIFHAEVKVLDLGEHEANLTEDYEKDFLLVKVDGQPYVLEWEWIRSAAEPLFGRVSATHIHLTPEGCRSFYQSWSNILHRFKEKHPGEDISGWHI